MAPIVAGTPRLSEATNSWRNSACGLYTFTFKNNQRSRALKYRKGSPLFVVLFLKASMVGFTLVSRSY